MMQSYLNLYEPISYETGKTMTVEEARNRIKLLLQLNNVERGTRNKVRLVEEVYRVVFYSPIKSDPTNQPIMKAAFFKMENEFFKDECKETRFFRAKWKKYINEGVVTDWVGMDADDDRKDKDWVN